MKPIHFS